jgi:N-acetyl-1-D-myo-inositol-2-amino-2-deoxy-alpha-D-glucopyranoside deacetylase
MLVHAHPDDETINNGVTMAKYVAEGASVTLVTCTLGEEGEVLVDELAHLAADRDDALGEHRIGELTLAMKELGVTDFRFLGGPGKYRDTGMSNHPGGGAMLPETVRAGTFWTADLLEAADDLVSVVREVRPQVLVTYDQYGGYGHPDHVQAHRVAMYGSTLAAVPSYRPDLGEAWDVPKIYWVSRPEGPFREGLRRLRDLGQGGAFLDMDPEGPLPPFVVPDAWITTEIDGAEFVEQKLAAMRAHATQITVDGPFFALADNLGNQVWALENYRIAKGRAVPGPGGTLENDLFAGVA